jgi:hypothetical protein
MKGSVISKSETMVCCIACGEIKPTEGMTRILNTGFVILDSHRYNVGECTCCTDPIKMEEVC